MPGLEFAGQPESLELGIGLLRAGGRFVAAGATFPSRPAQLSGEELVRRMIHITGVYNYAPEDLESALAFLSSAADLYPFEELVGALSTTRGQRRHRIRRKGAPAARRTDPLSTATAEFAPPNIALQPR